MDLLLRFFVLLSLLKLSNQANFSVLDKSEIQPAFDASAPSFSLSESESFYYDDDQDEELEYSYEDLQSDPNLPNIHQHKEETCNTYCYSPSNKCCGYTSSYWGSTCKSGKYQSPITLPPCLVKSSLPNRLLHLDGDLYKGKFSLENNGHTVVARFTDKNKTVELLGLGFYTLDRVEFKWGKGWDGAEHCIKKPSGSSGQNSSCERESMEVQFIHYKADKLDFDKAISTNQKDAVMIISVLIRSVESAVDEDTILPVLNPIIKQLDLVSDYGSAVTVKNTLDFTPWFGVPNVASIYHGSMTSPFCRQVVKWVVLHNPMVARRSDLIGFKEGVKGGDGVVVVRNRRPVQKRNKREVGCFIFGVLYTNSTGTGEGRKKM